MDAAGLPVYAWVLVALAATLLLAGLLHYFANSKYIDVKGRVYLITGGSSGIGKAVAKDILAKGGSVALVARKIAGLTSAAEELAGGDAAVAARVSVHAADITDEGAVAGAVDDAAEAHGRLDGIVCSAGTSLPKLFVAITAEEWEWMLRLNVVGTRNVIAAALPHLKSCDAGRIVLVSSAAGQVGVFGFTAYSASKFALTGLAQALAQELRIFNIDVTLFFPADTDTPLLEAENKRKPETCKKISETAGLLTADETGAALVRAMRHGWATASKGFLPELLTVGMGGAGTWVSAFEVLTSSLASGLVRFVLCLLAFEWNGHIDALAAGDYATWEASTAGTAAGTPPPAAEPASSVRRSARRRGRTRE